jgi:hypothetical protein
MAIVIAIIMATCIRNGYGQMAIYYAFQPTDLGSGIRVDYFPFNKSEIGIYNSISYGRGNYYKKVGITDHLKLTAGILVPILQEIPWQNAVTVGISYHNLTKPADIPQLMNYRIFDPFSFELGLTAKFDRFQLGLRTDIPRWESAVDVGVNF